MRTEDINHLVPDRYDTVALATLLALYGETPDWLEKLHRAKTAWLRLSGEERKQTDFAAELRNTGFLEGLQKKADATPMEILEYVITALDLDGKVSAMSYPDRRMGNLEELRRRCAEYMQQALLDRRAATPAGFVAALNAADAGQLRIYRKAVEEATGKPVRQTVIHLPNLGRCFLVE